jgi:hypothetical protein
MIPRPPILDELLDRDVSREDPEASLSSIRDAAGVTTGYEFSILLRNHHRRRTVPAVRAKEITWRFDLNYVVTSKQVLCNKDHYRPEELTRAYPSHKLEWRHRVDKKGDKAVVEACIGDLVMLRKCCWNVETTVQETLEDELDLEKTMVLPDTRPGRMWKPGTGGWFDKVQRDDLMRGLQEKLRSHVIHSGPKRYAHTISSPRRGEVHCSECHGSPCIWKANKAYLATDVDKKLTNTQKRHFAYKTMGGVVSANLPVGERCRKLPECVTAGVRALWPDERQKDSLRQSKKRARDDFLSDDDDDDDEDD